MNTAELIELRRLAAELLAEECACPLSVIDRALVRLEEVKRRWLAARAAVVKRLEAEARSQARLDAIERDTMLAGLRVVREADGEVEA